VTQVAAPVERCTLAPGLSIARVLTGLWQVADMERDGRTVDVDDLARAMRPYAEAGLTSFDMADHYGSAEVVAGRFRAARGGDGVPPVEFLTKWVPRPGAVTRAEAREAVERALDRLQGRAIDLLQFHAWTFDDPRWLDTLGYLDDLRSEGLVRQLGLTNFDTAHLRIALASGMPLVSNQVSYSLIDRRAAGRMTALCQRHGVQLLAYGTVQGGWLSERWLGRDEPDWERLETWSQMKYGRFIRAAGGWEVLQRLLRALAVVAERHGVSIANVASRYILEQPAVAGVIIGARLGQSAHVEDNRRLFSFALSAEDRAELAAATSTLADVPGDCGDEYRRPPYLTASGDLSHHLDELPAPYPVMVSADGRQRCVSGTTWETTFGYSRAVRTGNRVLVSGTTATHGDRPIGVGDASAQAHFAIDKIEGALRSLGARLEDVVRTRIYVKELRDWEAVARAHGERFAHIQPANTLVRAELIGEHYLVEIEAEAEITGR
jgi:aryl-alcohol dehydrogenase-like predicted oxidoreductase/enamine deaminase RidA (YjgF/YER057c/UK114 family)